MHILHLVRFIAFGVVLLFSVIILGLAANSEAAFGVNVSFASLALAVSILTIITIVPLMVIEKLRQGAVTSVVFVELIWTGLLWVLWLASGAEAASLNVDPSLCSSSFLSSEGKTICSSELAITAFSFLNWIILMAWFAILIVFSAIGNHWHSSVADTDLTKKNSSSVGVPVMAAAPVQAAPYNDYPAQPYPQQVQQYPQQTPSPGHTPGTVPV